MKNLSWLLVSVAIVCGVAVGSSEASEAPILDIDNLAAGYVGKISEHSVLVDLTPHLQIKNIEKINGICSYHVFKPNTEEFPFTVEIKDKQTGEAVIELLRKSITTTPLPSDTAATKLSAQSLLLDCNKRRSFDFLIQAHDCSSPSLYSNKVPVRIDVIDSDDYLLVFDKPMYTATLIKSDRPYQDFLTVRAVDKDCSNGGLACAYSLHHELYLDTEFPFKVNNEGKISTDGRLKDAPRRYQFKVRAYDCVSTREFVEADVVVEVHEPCVPEWTDYPREITSHIKSTPIFDQISSVKCPQPTSLSDDPTCRPDSVSSHVSLVLSDSVVNSCPKSADCSLPQLPQTKTTLFSASTSPADDDLEAYYDPNSIETPSDQSQAPINFRSFSKQLDNAVRINFDGSFGASFSLQAKVRRPSNADQQIKEQVICGSDSLAMNRHHYGLYFYRGSLKFLMRKEASKDHDQHNTEFYPSLWEWSLPQNLLQDNQWHVYEVRLSYPHAQLYVDGQHFAENKTNSDVVDAYELAESGSDASLTSYVGACYHARTNSLVDHFEGDIASVVLTRNPAFEVKCQVECRERIEVNMVGNEALMSGNVEQAGGTEIALKSGSLEEMSQMLRKVAYVNEGGHSVGSRLVKLTTSVHCGNSGKQISLAELTVGVEVPEKETRQFDVRMEGDSSQTVSKVELENGVEPFRQVSITVEEVNRVETSSSQVSTNELVMLAECHIQIIPERNLMAPMQNYEKIMFLQNLLDEYKFEFKETLDSVVVKGVASARNYEAFIRRLTYVVTNVHEVDETKLLRQKQFLLSCVRSEPAIETNTVMVELNVVKAVEVEKQKQEQTVPQDRFGFVAHKQAQKLVVGDKSDIVLDTVNLPHGYNLKSTQTSPLMVFLVALCIFGTGFFVILGAIRLSSVISGKRMASGDDNNNMDEMMWDDSGLNITENPLDKLESGKSGLDLGLEEGVHGRQFDSDEEYTSGGEGEYDEEDEELEGDEYGSQRFHQEHYFQSEEEEQSTARGHGLEWDDTSVTVVGNKYA